MCDYINIVVARIKRDRGVINIYRVSTSQGKEVYGRDYISWLLVRSVKRDRE